MRSSLDFKTIMMERDHSESGHLELEPLHKRFVQVRVPVRRSSNTAYEIWEAIRNHPIQSLSIGVGMGIGAYFAIEQLIKLYTQN